MNEFWTETGPLIALAVFVFLAIGTAVVHRLFSRERHRAHRDTKIPASTQVHPVHSSRETPKRRSHTQTAPGLATVGSGRDLDPIAPLILGDMTPHEPHTDRLPSRASDRLDTTISALICPECRLQYDLGGTFCPRDGTRLHTIETDAVADKNDAMVCAVCNDPHPAHAVFCPHDGGRLIPSATTQARFVPIAIPFCPTCRNELPPELHECPDDGTALIPMLGRRSCGHPLLGVGPKRKICPECGLRYGDDMQMCTRDRAQLVGLN